MKNEYFRWLCRFIRDDPNFKRKSYKKLLEFLHEKQFIYTIPNDGNRAQDGIELRYRFAYENHYDVSEVESALSGQCSLFEMMVALAIRCEEHIMFDPDIGDRTGQWFWLMLKSSGLNSQSDDYFDSATANGIADDVMLHNYKKNGEGGLFTLKNAEYDLRYAEIWYQMCWYLDEVLGI